MMTMLVRIAAAVAAVVAAYGSPSQIHIAKVGEAQYGAEDM